MSEPIDASQTDVGDCMDAPFPIPAARNPGAVPVIMDRSVWNAIREHGDATPNVEICGVLVGVLAKDADGPFLHICDAIRGKHAEGQMGQVTFTAETWRYIQLAMDAKPPEWRILGWYHTHPGFGIFLSGMDLFIENNFFNLPWQIAYVYDPLAKEEGLFAWSKGEPTKVGFLMHEDTVPLPATAGSDRPNVFEERLRLQERRIQTLRIGMVLALLVAVIAFIMAAPTGCRVWSHIFRNARSENTHITTDVSGCHTAIDAPDTGTYESGTPALKEGQ